MMRSEWENDEILERFRDWLTRTSEEIADSEESGAREPWADGDDHAPSPAALPEIGLLQVVEALTAMRHELKLQTKNGRSLEAAVQADRQSLDVAMRQFQSVQAREEESARRVALPLAEAMAGLDESLGRYAKALEITHRQLTEVAPQQLRQSLDDEFRTLPWWRRRLMRAWHARVQEQVAAAMARVTSEEFARLMEGYQLIQDRIRQESHKNGLRRVAPVGHRVDPTCMSVVEIVNDDTAPPETVVEELRPGYLWRQTVIRFAEVRAVRSRGGVLPPHTAEAESVGGDDTDAVT